MCEVPQPVDYRQPRDNRQWATVSDVTLDSDRGHVMPVGSFSVVQLADMRAFLEQHGVETTLRIDGRKLA